MAAEGFDSALIWGRSGGTYERYSDILYLSNYYSSQSGHEYDSHEWMGISFSAALMRPGELPEQIVDEPDYPPELLPIPSERATWHKNVVLGAAELLNRRNVTGRVALVGEDFLPVKYARLLERELPGV